MRTLLGTSQANTAATQSQSALEELREKARVKARYEETPRLAQFGRFLLLKVWYTTEALHAHWLDAETGKEFATEYLSEIKETE